LVDPDLSGVGLALASLFTGITSARQVHDERSLVGSVIKKRRKRMAKKKHRKLLKKTRIQRRRAGK
jgi:hypothetical protein